VPLRRNDPRRAARCYLGDCLAVLPTLPAESVDAVVTDPPAGISMMGATWDTFGIRAPGQRGSYKPHNDSTMLGNTRGLTVAQSVKARDPFIAFLTAVMRECLHVLKPGGYALVWALPRTSHWTGTAVEDAGFEVREKIYHLFGSGFPKAKSCLKPAAEEWILARKPGPRVLPLNIEESRISTTDNLNGGAYARDGKPRHDGTENWRFTRDGDAGGYVQPAGRWPANVCLSCDCEGDGHDPDCPVALLDAQAGERKGDRPGRKPRLKRAEKFGWSGNAAQDVTTVGYADSGGPARFFYCSKASKSDRGEGNRHPTVKSQALMRWLVGLVSFPGETVLDPFMGSGTTGVACIQTGRKFIGVELNPEYHAIATRRISQTEAEALAKSNSTEE
jgi:DNA modification methylase